MHGNCSSSPRVPPSFWRSADRISARHIKTSHQQTWNKSASHGSGKTMQRSSNKDMRKCDFDVTKRRRSRGELWAGSGHGTKLI